MQERTDDNQGIRNAKPLCALDYSKLVKEPVLCDSPVQAVVDTGSSVTVITPELLKTTRFKIHYWKNRQLYL